MKMFDEGIIADPYRYLQDVDEPEIWVRGSPKYADHIRVSRGLYYHHGIYVSDNEVIHFTGKEEDDILGTHNEVIKTDLSFFLKDGTLEIKEYNSEEERDLYPPNEIVSYARSCIGDTGYNLVFNNCEHFANVCTLGKHRSRQVENVFQPRLPGVPGKERKMSFLGDIWDGVKSIFGGGSSSGGGHRSSSTTTYEPDKVKVAEIEAENKIRLARMEQERLTLWRDVQLDLIQGQRESEEFLIQARVRGYMAVAEATIVLQKKLNEVALERLQIIEQGSAPMLKEMEQFYYDLQKKINEDNSHYSEVQIPKLLGLLEKYPEGSTAHKMYSKQIEMDMARQLEFCAKQIDAAIEGNKMAREAFHKDKEKLIGQTSMITEKMLASVNGKLKELGVGKVDMSSLTGNQLQQGSKKLALEEGKEKK